MEGTALPGYYTRTQESYLNSKTNTLIRAEANFKKKQRQQQEGATAMAEYHAQMKAVRENTARLRALRLAKEEAEMRAAVLKEPQSEKVKRS
jgi:hypothetical protein